MLSFLSPPIGSHLQAVEDIYGGPEQALRHSCVWRCADLIASLLSMCQPWAYKAPASGVSTPGLGIQGGVRLGQQPIILNQPEARGDIGDWLYSATMAIALRGNVYGLVVGTDPKLGYPTQVELQRNESVRTRIEPDGSLEYKFQGVVQDPSRVFHQAMFRPAGSMSGLSILQYAQQSIRTGQNAESFGNAFFEDGGHPTGLLLNDSQDEFSQEDAQTVKQKFLSAVHGSREPVVMTGGWKYEKIQVNPSDSQFLDTQKMSDVKVCRYFGVPPELIGAASEGTSLTYANVEQRGLDLLTFTMQRWFTWWERKLGYMLPGGQYVKFDLAPLLRTDIYTRARVNHALIASRMMTIDEVRQSEDLPPLTQQQIDQINDLQVAQPMPAIAEGLSADQPELETH